MKTIRATYEDGIFRPKSEVDLPYGAEVDVILSESEDDIDAVLKARFPNSYGGMSDEVANELLTIIEEECGRIDSDEWK